jgi:hypothetical protein
MRGSVYGRCDYTTSLDIQVDPYGQGPDHVQVNVVKNANNARRDGGRGDGGGGGRGGGGGGRGDV